MTEWKTYKLGDISKFQTGKLNSNAAVENGKYPFFTCSPTTLAIDDYAFDKEAILLAGNNAEGNFSIKYFKGKFNAYQRTYIIETKNDICDIKFLFYALKICLHQFKQMSQGTSTKFLTAVILNNFEISLPSLEEQRKIAGILGAIDDKIENNRRINTNLELQAQALYKQWFVDNRCDDWEIKSLSDLMDYQGGSQPPASEFIDKPQDGYVRFVQIRDYASNSHPTYIPIAKKNKLCNKKDIMIARYGASLGRICFGLEGAYNVALAKVKPLENYYREFLRCYLSSNEFYDGINMKGNRAVQAGFNQSDINSFMISCPKQDIFVAFENIVSKILDKRLVLQQENETLATLRDTLLPKLMNGEIKL